MRAYFMLLRINYKNLDREIETVVEKVGVAAFTPVSTIRISIARLKHFLKLGE